MFVDPRSGDLFVIDKEYLSGVGRVFRAPKRVARRRCRRDAAARSRPSPSSPTIPRRRRASRSFPGTIITGADISPDGSTILVRTYGQVLAFARPARQPVAAAFRRPAVCRTADRRTPGRSGRIRRERRELLHDQRGRRGRRCTGSRCAHRSRGLNCDSAAPPGVRRPATSLESHREQNGQPQRHDGVSATGHPAGTRGVSPVLQFVIVGLVLGSIYALAASGLVITYVSTGVLNFAFGSLAFFIARIYYCLHVEKGWGILLAAGAVPVRGRARCSGSSSTWRSSASCGCRRSSSRSSSPSVCRWRSPPIANMHLRQRRDLPGPGPRARSRSTCTRCSAPRSRSTR